MTHKHFTQFIWTTGRLCDDLISKVSNLYVDTFDQVHSDVQHQGENMKIKIDIKNI